MSLHPITPPIPATAITLAERLAELVEEGDVSAFAVAIVHRDGSMSGEWTDAPSSPALLGAIARLAHRFNRHLDDE